MIIVRGYKCSRYAKQIVPLYDVSLVSCFLCFDVSYACPRVAPFSQQQCTPLSLYPPFVAYLNVTLA